MNTRSNIWQTLELSNYNNTICLVISLYFSYFSVCLLYYLHTCNFCRVLQWPPRIMHLTQLQSPLDMHNLLQKKIIVFIPFTLIVLSASITYTKNPLLLACKKMLLPCCHNFSQLFIQSSSENLELSSSSRNLAELRKTSRMY